MPSLMHRSHLDPCLSLSGDPSEPPARKAPPRRPLRSTAFLSAYIPECAPEGTQRLSPSPAVAECRGQHAHPQVYMKTLPGTVASTDAWTTQALGSGWGSGACAVEAGRRPVGASGHRDRLVFPSLPATVGPSPHPSPRPGSGCTTATKGGEGACPMPGCLVVPKPTSSSGSCTASLRGRGRVESMVLAVPEALPTLTVSDRSPASDFQQLPTPVPHFAHAGTDSRPWHNRGTKP
ncbi:hypothetical protein P7K49_032658 [Saguinus oedipus]|uniref:Uncharacterized protein n=1 Tax=Saguinus oedipus TaxID=9490 RepID=A0ABQ9TQ35_SAGOE|nr:hypothetical protein P7K49_032658 [Saguinus oedipus]